MYDIALWVLTLGLIYVYNCSTKLPLCHMFYRMSAPGPSRRPRRTRRTPAHMQPPTPAQPEPVASVPESSSSAIKEAVLEVLQDTGLLSALRPSTAVQQEIAPVPQHADPQPSSSHEESLTAVLQPEEAMSLPALEDLGECPEDITEYLGAGLSPKLVSKIVNDEFVNMADLLFEGEEKFTLTWDSSSSTPRVGMTKVQSKSQLSINQWCVAYRIFMTIYTGRHPSMTAPLLKYYDLIEQLARDNFNWRAYDEQFRKKRQLQPTRKPWHLIDQDLYIKSIVRSSVPSSVSRPMPMPFRVRLPKGFCWAFDKKGKCETKDCKFKHLCCKCGAKHPSSKCNKN